MAEVVDEKGTEVVNEEAAVVIDEEVTEQSKPEKCPASITNHSYSRQIGKI